MALYATANDEQVLPARSYLSARNSVFVRM